MSERTLEEALAHAENWREYHETGGVKAELWPGDLVLLADEVKRLRECHAASERYFELKSDEIVSLLNEIDRLKEENDGLKSGKYNAAITLTSMIGPCVVCDRSEEETDKMREMLMKYGGDTREVAQAIIDAAKNGPHCPVCGIGFSESSAHHTRCRDCEIKVSAVPCSTVRWPGSAWAMSDESIHLPQPLPEREEEFQRIDVGGIPCSEQIIKDRGE